MARPTKPLILHALHGTARRHRHAKREGELVLTPRSVGEPPEFIKKDEIAFEEWGRLASDYEYSGVLSPVHRGALIEYCVLYARMIKDAQGIEEINASQRQTLNSLRMQLGITPASQSKVRTSPEKPASKWDEAV